MTILSAVQTYLKTYSGLVVDAPLWVEYLGAAPVEYSITPLPGAKVIEEYLNGASLREFPFAFSSVESTADDLQRLETSGFYEAFADWLEAQTEAGVLPTLGAKQNAITIQTLGWAFLYEQGVSDTGIFHVQCKLKYEQDP